MKKAHDTAWVGQPCVERMLALLSSVYFWPKIVDNIHAYMKIYNVCQGDNTKYHKEMGLLQNSPILEMR